MSISLNGDGIISGVSSISVGAGASVFSPAANTLALGTNGSERVRVDSSGNFGVGISNVPNYNANLRTVSFNNTNGVVHDYAVNGTRTGSLVCQSTGFEVGTHTSIPLIFTTNSNERLRVLAAGGLTFNGDTAAANALDDYEEGTWTATISGISIIAQDHSTYTKIGNTVFVRAHLNVSGHPGDTFSISGLPFTSSSSNRCAAALVVQDDSAGYAQISGPTALVSDSVSAISCDLHGTITLANNDRLNIFASYSV